MAESPCIFVTSHPGRYTVHATCITGRTAKFDDANATVKLLALRAKLMEWWFSGLKVLVRRKDERSSLRRMAMALNNRFVPSTKVMDLCWLDDYPDAFLRELEPEEGGMSIGPCIGDLPSATEVTLPAANLYLFHNARVSPNSSSVIVGDTVVLERIKGIDSRRCDFAAGPVVAHWQRTAFVIRRDQTSLDAGFFLGGNGSSNYYHWMVEILPKLQFFEDLEEEYQSFPLLVSSLVTGHPNLQASLTLVAGERAVIAMDPAQDYVVGRLLYVNSPTICPFNLRGDEQLKTADFLTRPSSVEFLRDRMISASTRAARHEPQRLFFARREGRRNFNQDEIFAIFERHGFRKVFPEEMSLEEQIRAAHSAVMIAGPTGAAWTNLIFCQPGARCLCWMAEASKDFAAYSNLAQLVGVRLKYFTYKTNETSTQSVFKSDYHLDEREVEKELARLLAED